MHGGKDGMSVSRPAQADASGAAVQPPDAIRSAFPRGKKGKKCHSTGAGGDEDECRGVPRS